MEYANAAAVLKGLMEKYSLSAEEREAVTKAITLLNMGILAEKKIRAKGTRRDQSTKW